MNRRSFFKGVTAVGGATILTGLYTWQIEPYWLEIVEVKMPIKNLPNDLQGKTLMQLSDLHIGNRFDYSFIINSFKKTQSLNPDFVVYTGDFVNWESHQQLGQLKEVFDYAVLGEMGTVGILGNHDYGRNWSEDNVAKDVIEILESSNLKLLRNEQHEIAGLHFAGIDDYWATNFNPQKVMPFVDNKNANVVLCHNPDVADLDVWNGYEGWILSGHTHGGQCKAPFLAPPMLPVKNKAYSAGRIGLSNGRTLYINRALGHLWQVRFNVRPEITLFHLMKPDY